MNSDTYNNEPAAPESEVASATETDNGKAGEESALTNAQAKLQEAEKKYLYLYSEFENFRRRNERDRLDFIKFGHEGFLRDLLQVMDNFERAVTHAKSSAGEEKGTPLASVTQGIEMIQYQLSEALKAQGVTAINAQGAKFDPALHDAVSEEESDAATGTIVKEVQRGYLLHGRLLRAAKVIVAKRQA